jgi:FixJ family two-component response regulator
VGHNWLLFLLDTDPLVRHAAAQFAASHQGAVVEVTPTKALGQNGFAQPGCVVADLCVHGLPVVDVQRELGGAMSLWPLVLVTASRDPEALVQVMEAGALTVVSKPVDDNLLRAAIQRALERSRRRTTLVLRHRELRDRFAQLTPGERSVLDLTLEGRTVKGTALLTDASQRTIDRRRQSLLQKLGVKDLVGLVRVAAEYDFLERMEGEG